MRQRGMLQWWSWEDALCTSSVPHYQDSKDSLTQWEYQSQPHLTGFYYTAHYQGNLYPNLLWKAHITLNFTRDIFISTYFEKLILHSMSPGIFLSQPTLKSSYYTACHQGCFYFNLIWKAHITLPIIRDIFFPNLLWQ